MENNKTNQNEVKKKRSIVRTDRVKDYSGLGTEKMKNNAEFLEKLLDAIHKRYIGK